MEDFTALLEVRTPGHDNDSDASLGLETVAPGEMTHEVVGGKSLNLAKLQAELGKGRAQDILG